jgi:hypothetical protein
MCISVKSLNGQSAAKPLLNEEGSETISRKESRLSLYFSEKPDTIVENLFSKGKFKKVCCIYCVFSKTKELPYIGLTVNLQRRTQRHRESLRKKQHFGKYLQRVCNKYGKNDIFVFIVEECQESELREKELYWIEYFDAIKNGFNARLDTQENFVQEDIKQTIREKNSKPVLMYNMKGEFIKEFLSVKDAAIYIGDQSTNISACCKGHYRHIKKHVFFYKNGFEGFSLKEDTRGTLNPKLMQKVKDATSKKVICNDILYPSVSEAERQLGLPHNVLGKCIKNNKLYKDSICCKHCEDIVQSSEKSEV